LFSDPEQIFKDIDITEEQKTVLIASIKKKMAPTPVKLRADFELTCFTYEGIDALKEALLTAKKEVFEEHLQVAVTPCLLTPPSSSN
jgi:translation initiation factor 2 subunit 1